MHLSTPTVPRNASAPRLPAAAHLAACIPERGASRTESPCATCTLSWCDAPWSSGRTACPACPGRGKAGRAGSRIESPRDQPSARASSRTMARPSPEPPVAGRREDSSRCNGSVIRSMRSSEMQGPRSSTPIRRPQGSSRPGGRSGAPARSGRRSPEGSSVRAAAPAARPAPSAGLPPPPAPAGEGRPHPPGTAAGRSPPRPRAEGRGQVPASARSARSSAPHRARSGQAAPECPRAPIPASTGS